MFILFTIVYLFTYMFLINLTNFVWLMFNVLNLYKLYSNKHVHTIHTYYIWFGLLCTFDTSCSIAHTYVYVRTYEILYETRLRKAFSANFPQSFSRKFSATSTVAVDSRLGKHAHRHERPTITNIIHTYTCVHISMYVCVRATVTSPDQCIRDGV